MSVTRKLPPDSVFAEGSSTELTTRSALAGVTCTVPADARQLLLSFVSGIAAVSSAHASTKYTPTAVLAGIVAVTEPLDEAPAASAGTARVPLSSTSPASRTVFVDR